jgi:hypothetical protein
MQKLPYFEGKRVTLPPYLDNKFLLVAITRQDSFSKSSLLFDKIETRGTSQPWPCHLHFKNALRQRRRIMETQIIHHAKI